MKFNEDGSIPPDEERGPRNGGGQSGHSGGSRGGGYNRGGDRGGSRSYNSRPSYSSQNANSPMRGPRHDDPDAGPKSAHPLAMQFRREREENFRRDRNSGGGSRPYKKTHY